MLESGSISFTLPGAERPILSALALSLAPGEFLALIGHNGSGKSTLCRLLSGLYLPSHGSVLVDGLDTARSADAAALRRLVQLVAHDPESQTIGQTVGEDVAFGLANFGLAGEELERRLAWSLELIGLSELRERPVGTLSVGQMQVLRLAGALAVRPRYLILDEAVAMLDATTRRRVLDSLQRLCRDLPLAILLATHDLEDLAWADRVCWLDSGTIALDLPTERALDALADHPHLPFDLPALPAAAHRLRSMGWPLPVAWRPEQLVEAVCASSC